MTAILVVMCYFPIGLANFNAGAVITESQNYRAQVSLVENSSANELQVNVLFQLSGKGNKRIVSFYRPDMILLWGGLLDVFVDGKRAPYVDVPKYSYAANRRVELYPGDKFSVAIKLRDIYVIGEQWKKIEIGFSDNAIQLENYTEYNKLILRRP